MKPCDANVETTTRFPDTLHEAFEAQARATPDQIAVCGDGEQIGYAELNRRASHLARELRRLGVGMETCVGLCADRGVAMIVGMLAILKSGAAYIPIDPDYPAERIRYIVEDGPLAAIVCSPRAAPCVASFGIPLVSTATAREAPVVDDVVPYRVSRRNLAYVIYTSGSTGRPKGVLVEHGHVLHLLEQTLHLFECDDRDVWAQFHSISFDFSVWEIWGALLTGARLVIVPSRLARAPAAFASIVDEQQITVLNMTPTAFRRFSHAYMTPSRTTTPLRLVVFGGEALSIRLLDTWISSLGDARPTLINMYGITETTVHVTYQRILARHRQETRSLIGRAIGGVEIHLLDDDGHPVPTGCPGRLYVSGGGVARGYRNRPGLTAQRFVPHPDPAARGTRLYDSGDLAVRLDSGEFAFLGRSDDQIKMSGYRIEPGEIESCLLDHPAVAGAFVMAEELGPDAIGLIAFVVLREGATPGDEDSDTIAGALAQVAQSRLPGYMRPSEYRFVSSFPLTAHGKIDRDALRATDRQGRARENLYGQAVR